MNNYNPYEYISPTVAAKPYFTVNAMTTNSNEEEKKRSIIDRLFGIINNTSITSGLYYLTDGDDDTGFMKGVAEGISNMNPFKTDVSSRKTTSDVLTNLGFEPETLPGKVAKGVASLAGDIVLDPLSYTSGLFSAGNKVVKGSGVGSNIAKTFDDVPVNKVEKVINGFKSYKNSDYSQKLLGLAELSLDDAKKIILQGMQDSGQKIAVDSPEILRRAEILKKDFDTKVLGLAVNKGKDIGIGFANLPFSSRIKVGDRRLSDFHKTVISSNQLRTLGDLTISPYYNDLAKKIKVGKIGKAFSPTHLAAKHTLNNKLSGAALHYADLLTSGNQITAKSFEDAVDFSMEIEKIVSTLTPEQQAEYLFLHETGSLERAFDITGKKQKIIKKAYADKIKAIKKEGSESIKKAEDAVNTLLKDNDLTDRQKLTKELYNTLSKDTKNTIKKDVMLYYGKKTAEATPTELFDISNRLNKVKGVHGVEKNGGFKALFEFMSSDRMKDWAMQAYPPNVAEAYNKLISNSAAPLEMTEKALKSKWQEIDPIIRETVLDGFVLNNKQASLEKLFDTFKLTPDGATNGLNSEIYKYFKSFLNNWGDLTSEEALEKIHKDIGEFVDYLVVDKQVDIENADLVLNKLYKDFNLKPRVKLYSENSGVLSYLEKSKVTDETLSKAKEMLNEFGEVESKSINEILRENIREGIRKENKDKKIKEAVETLKEVKANAADTLKAAKQKAPQPPLRPDELPEAYRELYEKIAPHFDDIARKEVDIQKLDPIQREIMENKYIYHSPTSEFKDYLAKIAEEKGDAPIWYDPVLGKLRTHDKGRTFSTIAEANAWSKEYLGFEALETDLADIVLKRTVSSNRLLFGTEAQNTFVTMLGKPVSEMLSTDAIVVKQKDLFEFSSALEHYKKKFKRGDLPTAWDMLNINEDLVTGRVPFVKLDKSQLDKLVTFSSAIGAKPSIFALNNEVVDMVTHYSATQRAMLNNDMLNLFDKYQIIWKQMSTVLTPGFHTQNALSNAFMGFLDIGADSFDPKKIKKAYQILNNKDPKAFLTLGGKKYTYKALNELAAEFGVTEGFYSTELGTKGVGNAVGAFSKYGLPGKYDPTNYMEFLPYVAGGKVGSAIEETHRMLIFISNLNGGKTPLEAAAKVNEWLYDYGALTNFEKDVMKRVIPFYTYMSKNVPKQLSIFQEMDNVYRNINYGLQNFQKMGSNYIPHNDRGEWRKDYLQFPFTVGGESYGANLNLPYMQLGRITPRKLAGQMSPFIKAPIELATAKYLYTGIDVGGVKEYIIQGLPVLNQFTEPMSKNTTSEKVLDFTTSSIGVPIKKMETKQYKRKK